jgi:hypothetical protein
MPKIQDLSDSELYRLKTKLDNIQEDRIRAQEQDRAAMEYLKELGFDSIDSAKEGLQKILSRFERLSKKADAEYEEFMEEYGEILSRR